MRQDRLSVADGKARAPLFRSEEVERGLTEAQWKAEVEHVVGVEPGEVDASKARRGIMDGVREVELEADEGRIDDCSGMYIT